MLTEEQRANRHLSIGGSDAPAICGMGPFASQGQTALGLYLEKTKQIEPEVLDSELLYWGNMNEANVMTAYAEKTGLKIQRVNSTLVHKGLPFMTAHLDRRVVAHPDGIRLGVEGKTTADYAFKYYDWGQPGTDEVPAHVMIQCMHYLAVTGYDQWDVAVLVGGNRHLIYHVPRDEEAITTLEGLEGEFWEHVLTMTPPPADFAHKSMSDLLTKMYPGTNGQFIYLNDEHLFNIHAESVTLKAEIKERKARAEAIAAELQMAVGENAAGIFPDGSGYKRSLIKGGPVAYERKDAVRFTFSKNIKP